MKLSSLDPRRGFTLIEVLVVIVIIGILSSMATVGMSGALNRERIRGVGGGVAAFLDNVHANVRKENASWSVAFEPGAVKAFRGSACESSRLAMTEYLEYNGSVVSRGVSSTPPGHAASWVNKAWPAGAGTCLAFTPRVAHHSVAGPGFVEVFLGRDPEFRALVFKRSSQYKLEWAFSSDGGVSWLLQ